MAIYDKKANSIKELAKYIEIDKAAISRIVNKLVRKGFLSHEEGKNRHSGSIKLTLTEA